MTASKIFSRGAATKKKKKEAALTFETPSLLYGEAQGAISKKDFIHKISLVLRELKETQINLRIIEDAKLLQNHMLMIELKDENNQLIKIFMKTMQTAKQRE